MFFSVHHGNELSGGRDTTKGAKKTYERINEHTKGETKSILTFQCVYETQSVNESKFVKIHYMATIAENTNN